MSQPTENRELESTSQDDLQDSPRSRIRNTILWLVLIFWFGLAFSLYSPHIIDDSFITFRFAERIAEGKGITYNDGVRIQGSSTPLWMLAMSFIAWIGIPLTAIGTIAGALFGLCSFWTMNRITKAMDGLAWPGILAALYLCGHFFFIMISVSGMETPVYIFVTLLMLYCVVDEKWKWIGLLAGILVWIRYDGAITCVVVFAFLLWQRGWKETLIQGTIAAALYLPWIIFAQIYFGTFVPQTVQTKLLIHYTSWQVLYDRHILFTIRYFPYFFVWLAFFLLGLGAYRKLDSRFLVLPVWTLFFIFVFLARRTPIANFIWYLVPTLPVIFLISVQGIRLAVDWFTHQFKLADYRQPIFAVSCVIIAFFQFENLISWVHLFGPGKMNRERAYTLASEGLQHQGLKPGDTVLTGEVGTIGYTLPEAYIFDGYGLVSPEVYEIRKRDRERYLGQGFTAADYPEGSPEATLDIINELEPDYVLIQDHFLFIEELWKDGRIPENYERLTGFPFDHIDQNFELVTLKRTD